MSGATRGLTMVEVMVSSTILAFIALVIMSATVPLSNNSAEQGARSDMDRDAMRFLSQLRRELRQSGYEADGTERVGVPTAGANTTAGTPGTAIEIYMRNAPDSVSVHWNPNPAGGGAGIRYATTTPVNGRMTITRTEPGNLPATVLENVQSIGYDFVADSASVTVTLRLVRNGVRPPASGGAPTPITKTYVDTIEMMNQPE